LKQVILLDDDDAIREIFPVLLNKAGFNVRVLTHGEEIVGQLFEEPDLFIIDKQLRGISGLDVCRYLKRRSQHKETPVIVISASNKAEQAALDAGADVFLEKPFKSAVLIDTIRRYTGN
jgi:DNA-binding response OmpR family regulator